MDRYYKKLIPMKWPRLTRLLLLFAIFLYARPNHPQEKPKIIDLQELSSATIVIKFYGTIITEGSTKSLVYAQPLPAEDENQKIAEISVDGGNVGSFSYKVEKDGPGRRIILAWENVSATEIPYEISVKIIRDSFNNVIASTKRGKDKAMLKSGYLTTPSKEIKKKSTALAKGSKSDLGSALKLAAWINGNIQYDPNYSQDKKDKTASQVFKKKRGTCDELSHLFISMARSIGLPAREVSGLAYNGEIWGFHSWSEIKFEDRWVPFDATNMQIGFVDATHMAFARDYDDAKFEQKVARMGEGAFRVEGHSMKVRIWKASRLDEKIKVDLKAVPSEIPPGWDFKLQASITNISSSYVAGPVRIIIPEEFTAHQNVQKTFLLAPGEQATLDWKVTSGGPSDPEGAYFYNLGAVTFPRIVAHARLTIATRMLKDISAVKNTNGTVSVDVDVENLFDEPKTIDLEICFYTDWELTEKAGCFSSKNELAASEKEKITIDSDFVPEGNFAVEVLSLSGGLSERRILKVDIGKN